MLRTALLEWTMCVWCLGLTNGEREPEGKQWQGPCSTKERVGRDVGRPCTWLSCASSSSMHLGAFVPDLSRLGLV